MSKYGGLSIFDMDMKKRDTIYYGEVCLVNKYGYALIGNTDKPYGNSMDHKYFFICDNVFDRIL